MTHRQNACTFTAVTHRVLIAVISFAAGGVLMGGVVSRVVPRRSCGKWTVAHRTCEAGLDYPFPSDPAGRMPAMIDTSRMAG